MATTWSTQTPMSSEVLSLRQASRELVRELGFLQVQDAATHLSHSHGHALIEIEARHALAQSELSDLLHLDKSTTSRIVTDLVRRRWVYTRISPDDGRVRMLGLLPAGRTKVAHVHREANARVEGALAMLDPDEQQLALRGVALYARALERSRRRGLYTTRPIRRTDRAAVALLIRTVMPQFGAQGPGFAINDPEVDDMFAAYRAPRSAYFVVVRPSTQRGRDVVVGAGGYAPLAGGDKKTCELRKMYFLPEVRGLGLGHALLEQCLDSARRARFSRMYLETLEAMTQARALYERSGFRRRDRAMGRTGHFGCDLFYVKDLRK